MSAITVRIECKDEAILQYLAEGGLVEILDQEAMRQEWLDYSVVLGKRVPIGGITIPFEVTLDLR